MLEATKKRYLCILKGILIARLAIGVFEATFLIMDVNDSYHIKCVYDGFAIRIPGFKYLWNFMIFGHMLMVFLPTSQFIDIMYTTPKKFKYFDIIDFKELQKI